jgi:hypothetical protein
MMTNPRRVGFAGVAVAALIAGAVAVAAVATIQPESERPARPAMSSSRAPELTAPSRPGDANGAAIDPPQDLVSPEGPIGSDWCPAGSLSIEIEGGDATTGHREAVLRATNVSNTPCVLDGYPDVAIADAHGNEVPLEIVHGSSFMATDPEPSIIILAPGDGAASVLGWDATDGRTSIGAVYVAAYAGMPRVALVASWNMTPSTHIATTAWQHD